MEIIETIVSGTALCIGHAAQNGTHGLLNAFTGRPYAMGRRWAPPCGSGDTYAPARGRAREVVVALRFPRDLCGQP